MKRDFGVHKTALNLISSFRIGGAILQENISRINSFIFIGDIDALNDEKLLRENKITHVVTTVQKTEFKKFLRITYCEPTEYRNRLKIVARNCCL